MKNSIIVSFWSPFHGQCGQTFNAVSLATYLATNYNLKILIMHSQQEKNNLESAFFERKSSLDELLFDESGIDAIDRLAVTRQLNTESFKDYTKNLLKDRLDVLVGTNKKSETSYKNMATTMPYILACAKKVYDIVIVDINSGDQFEITKKVTEVSDITVINLNQNIELLKSHFSKNNYDLNIKNKIYLLGNYEKKSLYNKKLIARMFNLEKMFAIYRNPLLMDFYNKNDVIRYFMTNFPEDTDDYEFLMELKRLSEEIIRRMKTEPKQFESRIQNVSLTEAFLEMFKKK